MLSVPGLRMPLRFLRGGYMWLALTVVALASGVALVAATDLVNRAVLRAFMEIIDTMAGRAALQVSAGEGALFPEDVAEKIRAVPGVEVAAPAIEATAFVADETGELVTIQGVDIGREEAVRGLSLVMKRLIANIVGDPRRQQVQTENSIQARDAA
jgi:hypothetical protein